jgi:predicted GIY-YIG superfamily endonuclease
MLGEQKRISLHCPNCNYFGVMNIKGKTKVEKHTNYYVCCPKCGQNFKQTGRPYNFWRHIKKKYNLSHKELRTMQKESMRKLLQDHEIKAKERHNALENSRQSNRQGIKETFQMKWSPCYPYRRANVQTYTPVSKGIYRLLIKNKIFYVGQATNLQRRLLEHLSTHKRSHCLNRYLQNYSCFFRFAELVSTEELFTIEREQIRKYKPPCNIDIRTIEEIAGTPKRFSSPLL